MGRLKLATIWLGGCSGCHMSFLDLDEWLLELTQFAELVFSPVVDVKEYPEGVDAVLVEGAVANDEHLAMLQRVRARTKLVIAFGDCAVTGNVTAMRNPLRTAEPVLQRSYLELADAGAALPSEPGVLPVLIDKVIPIHEVVQVDAYLPGCPPPARRIRRILELWRDEQPLALGSDDLRFG
jgi:NAD-reducing hydrogenase small subunit